MDVALYKAPLADQTEDYIKLKLYETCRGVWRVSADAVKMEMEEMHCTNHTATHTCHRISLLQSVAGHSGGRRVAVVASWWWWGWAAVVE